jgi:hypothetical protein
MQQSCKCKYFVAAEKAPAIMIQIITSRDNSGVKKKDYRPSSSQASRAGGWASSYGGA